MSIKRQVARGLKWQAISIAGNQVLSLLVFTTLARLLEPTAFGLVALVGVYLGFVGMFKDQGISTALIQRQNLELDHKHTAFWFNVGCAVILCLGTMALAGPVSALFKEPRLAPLLRWSSLALVIQASSAIHATLFTKEMDFRQPVIRGLIANAAGGVVGMVMALAGCGVWSLVGQLLAGAAAGAIFLWRMSTYRPALSFSWRHFGELFGVSSSVFVNSILYYFSSRLDQIIIGRFAGMSALGLYAIAGKLPNLAMTMTKQPLGTVSMPSMSQLQSDHAKMRQAFCHGMELNAVISFAVFVGLAAIAPDLVPLLFGAKWAQAGVLCSLLSLLSLVEALSVFFYPVLIASGGIRKFILLSACHTVGVLMACLIGIQFGITYLVLGLILNGLIMTIPGLIFMRQRIGLSPLDYYKPCLTPTLASLFMISMICLTVAILPKAALPAVVVACKIGAGAIAYSVFLLIFNRTALIKLFDMVANAVGFTPKTTSPLESSFFQR